MARMSNEQKLADRIALVMGHADFDPVRFGRNFHRCGWIIQKAMFTSMKVLIAHWAVDYDNQVTRDSDDYLILTMRARQLQDVIDKWT